ncbi:MAG TPA: DUF4142 domain-containing protein [Phycisphaerae bacterium]|jgi:putative membrane protein|nr:DUF4142 domain-containing protein [Phycisphaerae bacterium]HOB75284.1 DUF4142 domain-containing protein [Phycisphaerae bacterium]HOJ55040.1 DUF4142 domain-containing protein [Phycisphaerae bacterium]HOL27781.1 DUF4142 domain-containing protein [Phycisphaerae bacterium]HPP21990.1 DUF4142 domain-containing protein [Phycisphaerae bacterium]
MKSYVLGGAVLTVGLISALLAQQLDVDTDRREQPGRTTGERMAVGREANLADMNPDQRFILMAYQHNLFEVQLSKLVAGKTRENEIQQFAQTLSKDHTEANEELRQLAQRKNLQVPQGLNEWQQAKLQQLSRIPAEDLSRSFVFHQVGMHHSAILSCRWAANHLEDQDVKMLATRMVPDLQTHLRQAERLSQQLIGGRIGVTER